MPDEIPRRKLGSTGVEVSALGVGGHHLGDLKTVEEAVGLVHEAVDAGITFFDNCWEYWNGRAEDWLGRGLKGRRDKVFLMTKVCTHGRGADLAMKMLEESLRRLQTDHLDLWQIHDVGFDNDPELAYAKGGVLEALDKAKKQGKSALRRLHRPQGPGHSSEHDPLRLSVRHRADAAQSPGRNVSGSFEKQVLPELDQARHRRAGHEELWGARPRPSSSGLVKAEEMLRYAMSLPVATTICGMDSLDVLHQNLRVARGFKPMTEEEMQALRDRCARLAATAASSRTRCRCSSTTRRLEWRTTSRWTQTQRGPGDVCRGGRHVHRRPHRWTSRPRRNEAI